MFIFILVYLMFLSSSVYYLGISYIFEPNSLAFMSSVLFGVVEYFVHDLYPDFRKTRFWLILRRIMAIVMIILIVRALWPALFGP